jgi:hypothetical protein
MPPHDSLFVFLRRGGESAWNGGQISAAAPQKNKKRLVVSARLL